jgi:hypothetical protein
MNEEIKNLILKIKTMQININHLIEWLEWVKQELELWFSNEEIIKWIDLSLKLFGEREDPDEITDNIIKDIMNKSRWS